MRLCNGMRAFGAEYTCQVVAVTAATEFFEVPRPFNLAGG